MSTMLLNQFFLYEIILEKKLYFQPIGIESQPVLLGLPQVKTYVMNNLPYKHIIQGISCPILSP